MDKGQIITKMEQALAEVNQVKQQLQRNVAEVKSEIHSGISRQLEALRNREVWLLNQVELIQNMKDEVLHVQQARLNKMLGVAQSGLADSLGSNFVDSCDLKPDENPWIVFKSDFAMLRESITSYGRVESSNRASTSAFVKPGNPARSLPPHFEDYDDADHHVLYKTVEGVTKSTQDTTVTFTLPKLSSSSKDWLASSTSTTTTSSTNVQPRLSFPATSSSNQCWLKATSSVSPMSSTSSGSWQPSKEDTDGSIQMWLKDIKQNPVIEDEDDFEVISKRDFIGMERCSRNGSMSSSHSAPDLKYTDHETWLRSGTESQSIPTKSFKLPSHLETSSTETWLCRKWKRNAKTSCGEKCGQVAPTETENICDYLDDKIWVKSSSNSDNCQMDVCKANEPCQGPDRCLATPHCFYAINKDVFHHQDSNNWLLNGDKNVKPTTAVHSKMFEQCRVPPIGDNIWLKGGSNNQRNLDDWKAKPIQMDEKVWIKQDSSNALPDSTTPFSTSTSWDKVTTFHNQIGQDQWLLPQSDEPKEKISEDNPWILKSAHTIEEKINNQDPWIFTKKDETMDIEQ